MFIDLTLALSVIALVVSVIALIPFILYLIQRYVYTPQVFFRIGGEQSGEPIVVPKEGRRDFAVSTKSRYRTIISEVWVCFNPDDVNLSKMGGKIRINTDQELSMALCFSRVIDVKDKFLNAFGWEYQALSPEFTLKFIAYGQIDETENPFSDMFPARKFRSERLVKFKIREENRSELKKTGLALEPREAIRI